MLRRLFALAASLPWLLSAAAAPATALTPAAATDPAFKQIDRIVDSVAAITGLTEKRPVAYGRMNAGELRQFLAQRIKKALKPKEIYADELTLKMFGLAPPDFDLKKSTLDLLAEQAAAFYDYHAKKLFLLNTTSVASDETTLAHELAHALADQHFNLSKFVDDNREDDDENTAHTAVVEGEATWVMMAYQLHQVGLDTGPTSDMLALLEQHADAATPQYPVLQTSPLYVQQSLLFPYTDGALFVDAIHRKLGQSAFSVVFQTPPVSTAQILHPALYFAHTAPTVPPLPIKKLNHQGKEIASGTLGEFDHRILLWQAIGRNPAFALAQHLRGSQYRIVAAGRDKKPVLEYASEWDSGDSAKRYFAAYQIALRKKWKHCDAKVDAAQLFAGEGDGGWFVVRLRGRTLTSIEGLSDAAEWQALAQ